MPDFSTESHSPVLLLLQVPAGLAGWQSPRLTQAALSLWECPAGALRLLTEVVLSISLCSLMSAGSEGRWRGKEVPNSVKTS